MTPEAIPDLPLAPWDEQLIHASSVVSIGVFRARPEEPRFRFSGLPGAHLFVFPRLPVLIEHWHATPFVARPGVVTLYEPDARYFRRVVSPEGDRGLWFALDRELLERLRRRHCRRSTRAARSARLFPVPAVHSDPDSDLLARLLAEHCNRSPRPDPLAIEEGALVLAERVVARAWSADGSDDDPGALGSPAAPTRHRELARAACELLAQHRDESLSLADLAARLDCSACHLSRVFRAAVGETLHRFRDRLRLERCLEAVLESDRPLTDIALDHGFSSHSHFTASFRTLFRRPPSRLRERSGSTVQELLRELRHSPLT